MPRLGFHARAGAGAGARTVGELAKELVAIAQDGLRRVAPDSVALLDPVAEIAATQVTQADRLVELWSRHHATGTRAELLRALAHT